MDIFKEAQSAQARAQQLRNNPPCDGLCITAIIAATIGLVGFFAWFHYFIV